MNLSFSSTTLFACSAVWGLINAAQPKINLDQFEPSKEPDLFGPTAKINLDQISSSSDLKHKIDRASINTANGPNPFDHSVQPAQPSRPRIKFEDFDTSNEPNIFNRPYRPAPTQPNLPAAQPPKKSKLARLFGK